MNKKCSSQGSSSDSDHKLVPKYLDSRYQIIKNLGGTVHTRAHLAKDLATFDTLVIKIVEKDEKEELEQEYDFLSMLDHPNIIKPYLYASKGQITYEDDRKDLSAKAEDDAHWSDRSWSYLTLKFYENGDLFENISKGGPMHEGIARYYFHQLVSAVEYMHSKNVAHRDIKLDNILIDDNYQLILIDFGFAEEVRAKVTYNLEDQLAIRARGTKGYISPEQFINDGTEHICPKKWDIFALGVVLFLMVKGYAPFEAPTREDEYYQYLMMNKKNYFWKMHQKNRRTFVNKAYNILTYELKSLISDLLSSNPKERPDISEIKEHPWFQKKDLISDEEIKKLMSERVLH